MAEWIVEITDGLPHLTNMQPLVRCKDCIHALKDGEEEWCERMPWKALDPNWFCADGERREER